MRVYTNGTEIPLSLYNAAYLNHRYISAEFVPSTLWADKALTPMYFGSKCEYDSLKIQVMFKNGNIDDVSAFSEKLKKCEITINNAFTFDRVFDCVLKDMNLEKVSGGIYTVTYTFNCLVFGQTHTLTLNDSSNSFEICGAKETEAVISVENKTSSVLSPVKILDFMIDTLSAGEKIIIDGEKKTVTSNGENSSNVEQAFDRVEFFTFPRFIPEIHDITVPLGLEVIIAYRERF